MNNLKKCLNHEKTETKNGVVPKLRFPEFRGSGEWSKKSIEEVFRVTRGEVLAMPLVQEYPLNDCCYPVYSSQTKNKGLAGFYSKYLFENAITWTTDGANAGDVNFRAGKFFCTNVCGVLLNDKGYANTFVAELLNSVTRKYVSYVGNPKLMNGVMGSISIPFPSLPEQSRIADCLSSLDALIAAHSQKLDGLKSYKKGLMQQLFPAKGEKVPKLRFPEFRKSGEWEVNRLIDTVDKSIKWGFVGGPFGSNLKSSDYVKDGIRIIQLQNIGDAQFLDDYKIFTTIDKADELLSNNIYPGEIILSKMGDPVGRACIIPEIHDRYVMCSDGIRLVVDKKKFDKYFIYSLINSESFRYILDNTATGSTRKRIGLDELKNLLITTPAMLAEQQRIAAFLSSIDNLIFAQTQKIESLKTHKKGLMQQLFPAMGEANA